MLGGSVDQVYGVKHLNMGKHAVTEPVYINGYTIYPDCPPSQVISISRPHNIITFHYHLYCNVQFMGRPTNFARASEPDLRKT